MARRLLRRLTRSQFLDLVREWSRCHERALRAGEPGFGDETTAEDWVGSLDAWFRLREVAVMPEK